MITSNEKEKNKPVKSFLYLDINKMYSISSQLFEGMTDFFIKTNQESKSESESQKGEFGSGRALADIAQTEHGTYERRFLHDYAFTLFEQELSKSGKLLSIPDIVSAKSESLTKYSFVRVTGIARFMDSQIITQILGEFNKLGEAMAYVSTFEVRNKAEEEFKEKIANTKDPNEKARLKAQMTQAIDLKAIAKKNGLNQDERFLKEIVYLLQYGYADHFEIQVNAKLENEQRVFSAILDREKLTDPVTSLIKKYSRITQRPLTLFGLLTQASELGSEDWNSDTDNDEPNVREAFMNIIKGYSDVEKQFVGRLPNEVVIDPIALYMDL